MSQCEHHDHDLWNCVVEVCEIYFSKAKTTASTHFMPLIFFYTFWKQKTSGLFFTKFFQNVGARYKHIPSFENLWLTFKTLQNCKWFKKMFISRGIRPEVLCKKGVLRNSAKFTGKHLCQSLFFNKVTCLRPATLLKKRL